MVVVVVVVPVGGGGGGGGRRGRLVRRALSYRGAQHALVLRRHSGPWRRLPARAWLRVDRRSGRTATGSVRCGCKTCGACGACRYELTPKSTSSIKVLAY